MAKHKASTKRKQTIQLKETKKPRVSSFDATVGYMTQPTSAAGSAIFTSGEVPAKQNSSMDPKLANFLEEMSSVADNKTKSNGVVPEGELTQPQLQAPTSEASPPVATSDVTFWQAVVDPNTHHTYYWNPETGGVAWELPPGGVIVTPESEGVVKQDDAGESVDELMGNYPHLKREIPVVPIAEDKDEEDSTAQGTPAKKSVEDTATPGKTGVKRKSEEEDPSLVRNLAHMEESPQLAKKPRLGRKSMGEGEDSVSRGKGSLTPVNKKAEQMMRFKVSNLADQFTRKLEYLHVSTTSISSLEILSIKLQARLADWKEGGLPTKYMLTKLKQMNEELTLCESTAAPEGWKYTWDSSSCRYQFLNTSTGELTWEVPMQGPLSPGASERVELQDEGMEEGEEEGEEGEEEEDEGGSIDEEGVASTGDEEEEETPLGVGVPSQQQSESIAPPLSSYTKQQVGSSESIAAQAPLSLPAQTTPLPVQAPPLPVQQFPTTQPSILSQAPPHPVQPAEVVRPMPVPVPPRERVDNESGQALMKEVTPPSSIDYFSPTADYLVAHKPIKPEDMVMPPRYNKKAQALQEQKEERERLAKIERESRPITLHEVRQKLRPKLPYWKKVGVSSSREKAPAEPEVELSPEPEAVPIAAPTPVPIAAPVPDVDTELICEYPPRGPDPIPEPEPPRTGRGSATMSVQKKPASELTVQKKALLPPSHHMKTGELVFSSNPVTAKQQKELYAHRGPSSDTSGGVGAGPLKDAPSGDNNEKELREKMIRRMQSFKIGRMKTESSHDETVPSATGGPQRSSVSSLPEQEKAENVVASPQAVVGPSVVAQPQALEESVVESTGELEQEEVSSPPPPSEQNQPARSEMPIFHTPSEPRIEPETGIREEGEEEEEEPGEILDDSVVEADEVVVPGGVEEGRDLEEGEMGEGGSMSEGETPGGFAVEGKCYMDMEKTESSKERDNKEENELSDDDSLPPASRSKKERRKSRSPSPDSYRAKSKKKSRRHRDSDHSDGDRYSDGGYKRSSDSRRRSSHHHSSSSSKRHRDRSKDRSDSDDYYTPSSRRRHGKDRSYSPEDYDRDYYRNKSSRRSGKTSHYSSRYRSHSRSRSYDSDKDRDRESRRKSSSSTSKHKKRDKKKKRSRRSTSRTRDGSGDDRSSKPAPNVLIGKVGKISTVRPLGQEKKADESELAKQVEPAPPMAMAAMVPQQMSAAYYQQPSTGQVPYYSSYGYPYPYAGATQDAYNQQPPPEPEQPPPEPAQPEWQWGGTDPVQWAAAKAAEAENEEAGGSGLEGVTAGGAGGSGDEGRDQSGEVEATDVAMEEVVTESVSVSVAPEPVGVAQECETVPTQPLTPAPPPQPQPVAMAPVPPQPVSMASTPPQPVNMAPAPPPQPQTVSMAPAPPPQPQPVAPAPPPQPQAMAPAPPQPVAVAPAPPQPMMAPAPPPQPQPVAVTPALPQPVAVAPAPPPQPQPVAVTPAPPLQPQPVAMAPGPPPQPQSVAVAPGPPPQPQSVAVAPAPPPQPQPVAMAPGPPPQPQSVAVAPAPPPQPQPVAPGPPPQPQPVGVVPGPPPQSRSVNVAPAPPPQPQPVSVAPAPPPQPQPVGVVPVPVAVPVEPVPPPRRTRVSRWSKGPPKVVEEQKPSVASVPGDASQTPNPSKASMNTAEVALLSNTQSANFEVSINDSIDLASEVTVLQQPQVGISAEGVLSTDIFAEQTLTGVNVVVKSADDAPEAVVVTSDQVCVEPVAVEGSGNVLDNSGSVSGGGALSVVDVVSHTETVLPVPMDQGSTEVAAVTAEPPRETPEVEEMEECIMEIDSSPNNKPEQLITADMSQPQTTQPPVSGQEETPVAAEQSEATPPVVSSTPAAPVASEQATPTPPGQGEQTPPMPSITAAPATYSTPTSQTAAYNYATAYNQQQAYNYAYAQNYNNYAQAAYMQQAAAATYGAAAYGMQPAQYYQTMYGAAAYGAYPAAATATPYYGGTTGFNTTGSGYQTSPSLQSSVPAAVSTTPTTSAEKKGDFSLSGSKEKQMKNMMDKWKSFKDDI